jgi:hypothetical protein
MGRVFGMTDVMRGGRRMSYGQLGGALADGSQLQPAAARYSQPFSRAMRTASARLRAPVFWIAVER